MSQTSTNAAAPRSKILYTARDGRAILSLPGAEPEPQVLAEVIARLAFGDFDNLNDGDVIPIEEPSMSEAYEEPTRLPCAFSETRQAAIVLIALALSFISGWLLGRW